MLDPTGWALVASTLSVALAVESVFLWRMARWPIPAMAAMLPAVLLAVSAGAMTARAPDDIPGSGEAALQVEIDARLYAWLIRYPSRSVSAEGVLRLPAGRTVDIHLRSLDVLHSFWLPELGIKADAMPGTTVTLRIRESTIGTSRLVCGQLCGPLHPGMVGSVEVMPAGDFDRWLAQEAKGGARPPTTVRAGAR
jgi:cytochrome c oxidase subunit 2